jgi:hypothetical protein
MLIVLEQKLESKLFNMLFNMLFSMLACRAMAGHYKDLISAPNSGESPRYVGKHRCRQFPPRVWR